VFVTNHVLSGALLGGVLPGRPRDFQGGQTRRCPRADRYDRRRAHGREAGRTATGSGHGRRLPVRPRQTAMHFFGPNRFPQMIQGVHTWGAELQREPCPGTNGEEFLYPLKGTNPNARRFNRLATIAHLKVHA
jgi:hypothetical protein